MATVTPGVLVKLLQSMASDAKPAGVGAGEHRPPVLQVIGIVPAPPPHGDAAADPLWPSQGFYLQISDSAHSTFVSLSGADADAVLSSRPQLGQLIYVERLHFSHPVPRASGVRPVPPGRPLPFAGRPEPLIARSDPSRNPSGFLIQPGSDSSPPLPIPSAAPPPPKEGDPSSRTVLAARENVPGASELATAVSKRRFSSPAARPKSARKTAGRDPSPTPVKGNSRASSPALGRAGSRAASPVPSKCEVPGLVSAREENRRTSREPAIVVPSRYRQPSPSSRKGTASPAGRRGANSPARRLSAGLKVSPASADLNRKMVAAFAATSRVSDAMATSRSVRKSWEGSSPNSTDTFEKNERIGSRNKLDQKSILKTQMAISQRLSDASGENSSSEDTPAIEKPMINESGRTQKIVVHDQNWTNSGTTSFENLPDNLSNVGKEALHWRNIASKAAAEALEEARAAELIIRNLCMFSGLCRSSKSGNPSSVIGSFLSIYNDVAKLCRKSDEALLTGLNITEQSQGLPADPPRKGLLNAWLKESGAGETTPNLSGVLRKEMQGWFLRFVEEALGMGFLRMFGGREVHPSMDKGKVAAALSQLKQVNEWLDDAGSEEASLKETIERLKRKIYGFVIDNVGSALDASVSL